MTVRMLLGWVFAILVASLPAEAGILVEPSGLPMSLAVGPGASVLSFPGGAFTPPAAEGQPSFSIVRDAHAEVGRYYTGHGLVAARAWWGGTAPARHGTSGTNAAKLAAMLRDIRRSYAAPKWRLLTFATAEVALPRAACRGYSVGAVRSSSPGGPGGYEAVRVEGRVCVFPDRELSLRWEYGERRAQATPPLATFEDEAAAFIASLRFD